MNERYTDITFLIDKSTSMENIRTEVQSEFNDYLRNQTPSSKDDTCLVTVYDFNTTLSKVIENKEINKVDSYKLQLSGMTSLLDSIGDLVDIRGRYFASLPEALRPAKVLFVIITDGQENSSKRFRFSQVKELIENQKKNYNWEFVFIGAGLDNLNDAQNVNIKSGNMMNFAKSDAGIKQLFGSVSRGTSSYRGMSNDAYVAQVQSDEAGFFQESKP